MGARILSAGLALAAFAVAQGPAMAQPAISQPTCTDLQAVAAAMAGDPAAILGPERNGDIWSVSVTLYGGKCIFSPTSQSYGCVHTFNTSESALKARTVAGENVFACLAGWKIAPPSPVAPGSLARSSATYTAPDGKLILMIRYYETEPALFSLQHEFIRIAE